MALGINDLFGKKGVRQLLSEDVQYSTLVSLYRSLGKKKHDMILKHGTSFIDIIINSGLRVAGSSKGSKQRSGDTPIEECIWNIIYQKIQIGLLTMDQIPVDDIRPTILRMDTTFISDEVVKRVYEKYPQNFLLKRTGKGLVLRMVQYRDVRLVGKKEKPTASNPEGEKAKSAKNSLITHLYHSKPELVRALQTTVAFKDILKMYHYWSNLRSKGNDFIDWLLLLARENTSVDFAAYREALDAVLLNRICMFLGDNTKTIGEIVDNMCIDKTGFVQKNTIRVVIESYPEKLAVVFDENLPIRYKVATVYHRKLEEDLQSLRDFVKQRKEDVVQVSLDATEKKTEINDELALPERIECRILPLLTLHNRFDNILKNYCVIHKFALIKMLVEKYGCFFYCLIEKAKVCKPKLSPDEYTEHLVEVVAKQFGTGEGKSWKDFADDVYRNTPHGFLNDEFLRKVSAARTSKVASVTSEQESLVQDEEPVVEKDDVEEVAEPDVSPDDGQKANADLESQRVMHLLKHPRFIDIFDVFSTLPGDSVSILEKNSMSFFEWLIQLYERLMPHDAPTFQTLLHNIVQAEVARLHSKKHCQMTIQHVHSLICNDKPMLLSPNFLSWCLEQPGSSFTVHQSWIYLRNNIKRSPAGNTTNKSPPIRPPSPAFDSEAFAKSIIACKQLFDVIEVIKRIPLNHVGQIMQSGICWYEYIENVLPSRRHRQNLESLLTQEVDRCLGGTVQYLETLRSNISHGIPDFVTSVILEETLRRRRERYALSTTSSVNCKVALVRKVVGIDVKCADAQEEVFLREVLFYFPSSGSCDVKTVQDLANKEHSFLYKKTDKLSIHFLECFFMAFPMLFYLRGDVVVLTCMALDLKLKWLSTINPPSTTCGNGVRHRKRPRTRHGSKSKRRKQTEEKEQDGVIVIESGSDVSTSDAEAANGKDELRQCATVVEDENIKNSMESLLPDLVVDISTSLLHKNEGRSPADQFMRELLSMVLGADEGQQVLSSPKYWLMFKKKISEMLVLNNKFAITINSPDDGTISEIMIAEENEQQNKVKHGGEAQVGEITSTSVSPVPQLSRNSSPISPDEEENTATDKAGDNATDDIIKLPSPYPISDSDQCDEREKASTLTIVDDANVTPLEKQPPNDENDKQSLTYCPTPVTNHHSSAKSPDRVSTSTSDLQPNPIPQDASKKTSNPTPSGEKLTASSQSKPAFPRYSSTSSASSNYKQMQNVMPKPTAKAQYTREEIYKILVQFLQEYMRVNAGNCATDLLIADAFRRLRNYHFARSRLAFEAYMFDVIATNKDLFILTGTGCEMGVTKLSYKSTSRSPKSERPNETLWKLIPNMCPSCVSFLSKKPGTRALISDVAQFIIETYSKELESYPKAELPFAIRCLILVVMIRNLQLFRFAINEAVVYLRNPKEIQHKPPDSRNSIRDDSAAHFASELRSIMQNEKVKAAILLMGSIVKKSRPRSQALRDMWQKEAPASLAKVFGTGISFTLSMRKYGFLFPTSNGTVTVNEHAMEKIRSSRNSIPHNEVKNNQR